MLHQLPTCVFLVSGEINSSTNTQAPPAVSGAKVPSPESYQQPINKNFSKETKENYKGSKPNVYREQRKEQRLPPANRELTGVQEGKPVSHH